jgi:CheY-like chemotaxis protein/anti-sigma regulatory factor (Ser/Thr protein kinase)
MKLTPCIEPAAPAGGATPRGGDSLARGARILVVEDDHSNRTLFQLALVKRGYEVAAVEDATTARAQLSPAAIGTFDGVITDYRLPDSDGLELLSWIRQQDPALATIVVTAEGEKRVVSAALRGGASDFLDKPLNLQQLSSAVSRAVERTRRQRRLAHADTAVQQLGRAQARLLQTLPEGSLVDLTVCFHPRHEAGGDFFSHFQPAPARHICLLTDVSGHDVQAAYVSAYFQGIVRGMLERGAPPGEVFAAFNRLLLEEWSPAGGARAAGIEVSVAACALLIDTASRSATVLVQGTPSPVYWLENGQAWRLGLGGGFPLGWSAEGLVQGLRQPVAPGGTFCLWTDGLQQAAEKRGVSELSLAWAWQRARSRGDRLAESETADDDVLLAEICLAERQSPASFRPLIVEEYAGDMSGEIDGLQKGWERSLELSLPELSGGTIHDVLLASREGLLNALNHGCGRRADRRATFQVAFRPEPAALRVWIADPGPGHQFDLARGQCPPPGEPAAAHRGLVLMQNLAQSVRTERGGAEVTMEFTWP